MLPVTASTRFQELLDMFRLGAAGDLKRDMKKTNCVISGSAALYMFHPGIFIPNDIDCYVAEEGASQFKEALGTMDVTLSQMYESHKSYAG